MRKEEELQRAIKACHEAAIFADKLDGGAVTNNHHGNGNGRQHNTGSAVPAKGTSAVYPGTHSIDQYSMSELIQLLQWIASDSQLRTDDQLIDEMIVVLGFSRRERVSRGQFSPPSDIGVHDLSQR